MAHIKHNPDEVIHRDFYFRQNWTGGSEFWRK